MYCVVDIETTGGNAVDAKIIEIAIVKFDGVDIIDSIEMLINPEIKIPPFVSNLTHISDDMLKEKPLFIEVANDILEFTKDCIFVSHPISMDYVFLQKEFNKIGLYFERKTLCTLETSKLLIPNQKRYNLKNLCNLLGIDINGHHRAMGDAIATTMLLKSLLKINPTLFVLKIEGLNPKLDKNIFVNLPKKSGIFCFYNEDKKLIFYGKTNNIQNRTIGIFQNNSSKKSLKIRTETCNISHQVTGSKLISILQIQKIKNRDKLPNKILQSPIVEGNLQDNELTSLNNFVYFEKGRNNLELSFFLFKNRKYVGYGWINAELSSAENYDTFLNNIYSYKSDNIEEIIIFNYLRKSKNLNFKKVDL